MLLIRREHRLFGVSMALAILLIFFPYDALDGMKLLGFNLDTKDYNNLGDFIGGIAATYFSGIAVYLLYLTYNSQKAELGVTRRLLHQQQFETALFSMIDIHTENVRSVGITTFSESDNKLVTVSGRAAFPHFYQMYKTTFYISKADDSDLESIEFIKDTYSDFYRKHQSQLGHYFRTLYHIIKYISSSDAIMKEADRKIFIGIVRAQLSSDELLLLFYNCLSEYGRKFKPLIEKHEMLQNMPQKDVILESHRLLYDAKAYGSAHRKS